MYLHCKCILPDFIAHDTATKPRSHKVIFLPSPTPQETCVNLYVAVDCLFSFLFLSPCVLLPLLGSLLHRGVFRAALTVQAGSLESGEREQRSARGTLGSLWGQPKDVRTTVTRDGQPWRDMQPLLRNIVRWIVGWRFPQKIKQARHNVEFNLIFRMATTRNI